MMVESSPASGLAELPHLSTFLRAAERGSFTDAAADLGVTQAAVSQRIALLEGELRVSLFDRRAGRIALTEAGSGSMSWPGKSSTCTRKLGESLGGFRPSVAGDLPIAASSVPAECYLPALLSSFREKFPGVHVRASVGDSGSVMKEVEKGLASLGLVGQKAEKAEPRIRPIGTDTLVLILAPGHPLGGPEKHLAHGPRRRAAHHPRAGLRHSLCPGEGPWRGRVVARRDEYRPGAGEQRGHQGCRRARAGCRFVSGWPSSGSSPRASCGPFTVRGLSSRGISIWSITAVGRSRRRRRSSSISSNRTASGRSCHKRGLCGRRRLSYQARLSVAVPRHHHGGCV